MRKYTQLNCPINSLYELFQCEKFTIGENTHEYKLKEASDGQFCLMYNTERGWENQGYVSPHRRHLLKVEVSKAGILFRSTIKLHEIRPIVKTVKAA